jgi:probable HAF family extracellular repeat protein
LPWAETADDEAQAGHSHEAHATLFSTSGDNQDLGTLGGTQAFTRANAINDAGQIVGEGATGANLLDGFAFLYEGGSLFNLNDLIQSVDPLFANALLLSATGINNAGQIVGTAAVFENGAPPLARAFLLTPVAVAEPAPLALIAMGFAGLAGFPLLARRHRHS